MQRIFQEARGSLFFGCFTVLGCAIGAIEMFAKWVIPIRPDLEGAAKHAAVSIKAERLPANVEL